MAETLDEEWNRLRGMEIQSVGIASISMMKNRRNSSICGIRARCSATRRCARVCAGAMARGFEAAGSNGSGATAGFMGMGAGMNFGGFHGPHRRPPAADADAAARQGYAAPQDGRRAGEWSAAGLRTAADR